MFIFRAHTHKGHAERASTNNKQSPIHRQVRVSTILILLKPCTSRALLAIAMLSLLS